MPFASSDLNSMYGYVHQPDAYISEPNPVSATWYTVLAATPFVRVKAAVVWVTYTVPTTPLEMRVTIDGEAIIHSVANPVSNTTYFARITPVLDEVNQDFQTTTPDANAGQPIYEGKNVTIEIRSTGGTVSAITCRVKWAQKQVY